MQVKGALVTAALLLVTTPAWAVDPQSCIDAAERGQKLRDDRKLLEAREAFVTCSRPECPAIVLKDCTAWVERSANEIPKLVARAKTEDGRDLVAVRLLVDGKLMTDQLDGRRIAVNPGAHAVRFEVDDREPHEETVVLAEGENRTLTVTLARKKVAQVSVAPPPPPPSSGPPVATFVLGAVSLVGFASFGYFGMTGTNDANDLRNGCSKTSTCSQGSVDDIKTKYLIADVSLGIGIAALGGAIAFWALAPSKKTTGFVVTPGGVAGRF